VRRIGNDAEALPTFFQSRSSFKEWATPESGYLIAAGGVGSWRSFWDRLKNHYPGSV
jgi:hypothetical protein